MLTVGNEEFWQDELTTAMYTLLPYGFPRFCIVAVEHHMQVRTVAVLLAHYQESIVLFLSYDELEDLERRAASSHQEIDFGMAKAGYTTSPKRGTLLFQIGALLSDTLVDAYTRMMLARGDEQCES